MKFLITAPESFGDCFERARHLPELTSRGIDWSLVIRPELVSIFKRAFPDNTISCEKMSADFEIDLLDGVARFLNSPVLPDPIPFRADPDRAKKYSLPHPAVGICFQSASRLGDNWRSLKESETHKILAVRNVNWVSLQHPKYLKEYWKPLPCLCPEFSDWEDTLGLTANLDAVVSIDSAVAHLSLAMGKSTVILLGTAPTSQTKFTDFAAMYPKSQLKVFRPIYGGSSAAHSYELFLKWAATPEWPQFIRASMEPHA